MATGIKNESNDTNRQGQGGSGSAENIGQPREAQKAKLTHLDENQKEDIAEQTGLRPQDILALDEQVLPVVEMILQAEVATTWKVLIQMRRQISFEISRRFSLKC